MNVIRVLIIYCKEAAVSEHLDGGSWLACMNAKRIQRQCDSGRHGCNNQLHRD